MERDLYSRLKNWKNHPNRKPLILEGARQVGKTYLVKKFAKKEYENLAYFDFEENPDLNNIFQGKLDPTTLLPKLEIIADQKISPQSTLIFFDEIQASPLALSSLKYFLEQANQYHIIAAGSLLGIKLGPDKSFPVGKVDFLKLFPLTFFEFLNAQENQRLKNFLEKHADFLPIGSPIHQILIEQLRLYYFVGGMPEAVFSFIQNRDFKEVRKIHKAILKTYELDFAKHATPSNVMKISLIWNSIPRQLAKENKRFIFSAIRQSARAREYEEALQWLLDAGLIYKSYHVSKPNLPLEGYTDFNIFKVYLLDVGLLATMADIPEKVLIQQNELFTEYKGAFTENYVAAELMAKHEKPLYYWASQGIAEVDFIVPYEGNVFPLEVKANFSKRKKSLKVYGQKYQPPILSRTTLNDFKKDGTIANYPLYAIGFFPLTSFPTH